MASCKLVETAEAIVVSLSTDDANYVPEATAELIQLTRDYAVTRPGIPVIMEVPPSKVPGYQALLGEGGVAMAAPVTEQTVIRALDELRPPTPAPH